MKHIKLIVATALVLVATPAFAANWVYVTNSRGAYFYYDSATIQHSGNGVTVWEKYDFSRDKTVKQRETKALYRYNCADRARTLLTYTNYFPDGKIEVFNIQTYQQQEQAAAPDTVAEKMLEAVCQ